MPYIIGIDLGTTNSCVAVYKDGQPVVIPNKGGYKTTPSIVAISDNDKRLVGHVAKRQAITNAEHTVYAAKRLIGRRYDSDIVKKIANVVPYKLVEGPNGDVRVELRGRVYSIPEISSMILQEMKLVAESYLNETVTKAVITVPAYFNDAQRQATRDAGTIAGLEVEAIINEPTAAALAYGYGKNINRRIAVYDIGGGTFDISIVDVAGENFKVISTAGDSFLGGEDIDNRIMDYCISSFMQDYGIDLRQDAVAIQRLKEAAEKAKCDLSILTSTEISIPFIATDAKNNPIHLRVTLTRDFLEEISKSIIEKTFSICDLAFRTANIDKSTIKDVLLVGGQSRMPMVARMVKEYFGLDPSKRIHPDEAVAIGAAIKGHMIQNTKSQAKLVDVTSHSLGIMVAGGYFSPLIEKNTPVPAKKSRIFTTVKDNQEQVKIIVLQGEGKRCEENELLGEFILSGLRKGPRGSVEIEVVFEINADGIVLVSAKDVKTGFKQEIIVTATSGLTEDEIQRMAEENRDYLLEMKMGEDFEKQRYEVKKMISEVDSMLEELKVKLKGDEFFKELTLKIDRSKREIEKAIKEKDLAGLVNEIEIFGRVHKMCKSLLKKG
ncbi:MAG: molecular chaperone DnaK [Deltaproteobacteria bacterium]|nr:molecular chaperone DnaK [Deltaproteobacteria bacterium]